MKYYQATGSEIVSRFFYIPNKIEQSAEKSIESSSRGIFIGRSRIYSVPFFLDFESLINPHTFILGMSGGGKTFLMKNLLLKARAVLNSTILVIDFTGEYKSALDLQSEKELSAIDPLSYMGEDGYRTLYFNLSGLREEEKIVAAGNILDEIVRTMRLRSLDAEERIFILLDEAWKLLKGDRNLEVIIREGRKYKVGLVLASQLIEDLEVPLLASSGTLFIFKIQNKRSLERLSKNYNLDERTVEEVQDLEVGSCLAIQVHKSGVREAFVISKVVGVSMKRYVGIMISDIMMEIEEERLGAIIRRLASKDPSALISEISGNRSVELHDLVKKLMLLGANRKAILNSLRELGLEDHEVSNAFAFAIEEMGIVNEDQLPA